MEYRARVIGPPDGVYLSNPVHVGDVWPGQVYVYATESEGYGSVQYPYIKLAGGLNWSTYTDGFGVADSDPNRLVRIVYSDQGDYR